MELKLVNGDYVPDGMGNLKQAEETEETIQRALYKLKARRGSFPLRQELGSRLYKLSGEKSANLQSAAEQYVLEALAGENVTVNEVSVSRAEDVIRITVHMDCGGESIEAGLSVG